MSKKILVVVGMAVAIAAAGGAISLTVNNDAPPVDAGDATEPVAVTEAYIEADDQPDDETGEAPTETATQPDSGTEAEGGDDSDSDTYGYADVLSSAEAYRVARVIDHTTSEECTAREVFGSGYNYCYLSFGADGRFELCLNPASGEIRKGGYKVFGDIISAEYNDGSGSEFNLIPDDSGGIAYIMVNYGDYDVYFG